MHKTSDASVQWEEPYPITCSRLGKGGLLTTTVTRVYMPDNASIYVFYDAVCPICRNDRARFERWAGKRAGDVQWCDATEHQQILHEKGVALEAALRSLHIEKEDGHIIEGIEAYQLLMMRIPVLRPVAWLIGLPGIKRALRWYYDRWVQRRLKREGRWSD